MVLRRFKFFFEIFENQKVGAHIERVLKVGAHIETLKNKNNNNHFSKLVLIYRDGFVEKLQ